MARRSKDETQAPRRRLYALERKIDNFLPSRLTPDIVFQKILPSWCFLWAKRHQALVRGCKCETPTTPFADSLRHEAQAGFRQTSLPAGSYNDSLMEPQALV